MRVVPGGSSIRDGAYRRRGRHLHAADVHQHRRVCRRSTLVDSHALVGSCAQVGARVHISAGAQIGGVIEPVGALPVIIEDDVLVGGNTGIYEGAVIKRRAVIGAGTILTGSTPIYDLAERPHHQARRAQPLVVPEGAVVVPGARAVTRRWARDWGLSLVDARDREVPRRKDRRAHGARSSGSVSRIVVALARALVDIDSTTGREGDAVAGWRRCSSAGLRVEEQPGSTATALQRIVAASASAEVVFSTHFDCVPPFFPSRVDGGMLHGRGSCDAKGIWPRQCCGRAAAARRATRVSGCCSSSAKNGAATAPKAAQDLAIGIADI